MPPAWGHGACCRLRRAGGRRGRSRGERRWQWDEAASVQRGAGTPGAGGRPCATGRRERREPSGVQPRNPSAPQAFALRWTVRFSAACPRKSRRERFASRSPCGAIHAGSRKRDPALFNSGLGERSPGPLRFSPTFPRPSTLREHDARVDSVRAESAAGVKERATRALWTAFALSLPASGERETESV